MNDDCCVFEYLYRDAGNWKTHGEALLIGSFSSDLVRRIEVLLDSDRVFVPEQVGLRPLQPVHGLTFGHGSGLDQALHEFVGLRHAADGDSLARTPTCTVEEVIEALKAIGLEWGVGLSPYR